MKASLATIIEHSFRDFHAKGFDYICLKRTPEFTIKVYFFDGDVSKLSEVVNPHDHRYAFQTDCLAGRVRNKSYSVVGPGRSDGELMQRFSWSTPLNGGDGFSWSGEDWMRLTRQNDYGAGQGYLLGHDRIHTIQMVEDQTVLMLYQFEDIVPLDKPTSTWTMEREPPSLSGLYSKFKPDQILQRIDQLRPLLQFPIELKEDV